MSHVLLKGGSATGTRFGPSLALSGSVVGVRNGPQLLLESNDFNVNTADIVFMRINSFTQRTNGDGTPNYLGDLQGKLYGTGIYNGVNVALSLVEKAVSYGGPYTIVDPLISDPAHQWPATAVEAGSDFNLVIAPEEYIWNSLWFQLTVNFQGVGDVARIGGLFWWNTDIYPAPPAFVTVPASDSDGNYQVTWPEVPGLGAGGYYLVNEGIETDEGIAWEPEIQVVFAPVYNAVDKAGDTTYWYKVAAVNGVGNQSPWTYSTNGCRVERPSFKITPDLGWSNRDEMFDLGRNQKLAIFPLDELETTADNPTYVKNRNNLIFPYDGVNYIIPSDQIDKFGANGKHYWRYMSDPVQTFILSRNPLNVESGEARRAPDRSQPRIIG